MDKVQVDRQQAYKQFRRLGTTYLRDEWPDRRPLKIFAFDPSHRDTAGNIARVDVPNEELSVGPSSDRIKVVDYDGSYRRFYAPVDLNEGPTLMRGGLDPSESDPRFHQQMVFAVAMRVIENFEKALGRRISFRGRRLLILPHAFRGANAFFDPRSNSVLLGYFSADKINPGANLPGQTVFTCLSHDIVAHEMTHAILYRLRPYFNEPTNRDVLAFHEGFADIVAIFQHFTFPDVLYEAIQKGRGNLRTVEHLLGLARQFGHGTGSSSALRSALEVNGPQPSDYREIREPHARGSLLVAAIFDTFFATYQARIEKIVRVATGGTGQLPEGDLHPDLITLLAEAASKAAQSVLAMCIRAVEFLAPIDVNFGDYLRSMVTADYELYPEDTLGQRAALIEAFRKRGIYPDGVRSLADESLLWAGVEAALPQLRQDVIAESMTRVVLPAQADRVGNEEVAGYLQAYAREHAAALGLDPNVKPTIRGFHPIFRVGSDGRVRVELVCTYLQKHEVDREQAARLGGLPLRAGVTIVFSQSGAVRYLISKPLALDGGAATGSFARSVQSMEAFVTELDLDDEVMLWKDRDSLDRRMLERANFAVLDRVRRS